MSYDRVIQDSDDDDDPLSELPPPQPDRVPLAIEDLQSATSPYEAHEANPGANINVNFDQFLQSQEAMQTNLPSSQQRREERWIPAMGRGGSIGTMMTEIGLAQQRLLDDDHRLVTNQAQFIQRNAPPFEYAINQDVVRVEEPNFTEEYDRTGLDSNSNANAVPQITTSSCDWSQSVPSYNIFESSSLQPSTSHLNRADFIDDSVALLQPGSIFNSPRRWISADAMPFSPHDTIPFSSVVSPKATRTKSDSAVFNALQPSQTSVDELSMPVVVEMPTIEKTAGPKMKQSLPENDEDDELAQPKKAQEPASSKPEKRKPGRPPKNQKVPHENNGISNPTNQVASVLISENEERVDMDPISNDITGSKIGQPQVIVHDSANVSQQIFSVVVLPEVETTATTEAPSKKTDKQPKKKKLKRGKTTPATLKKTHGSDIEDDVIWVDERLVIPPAHDKNYTIAPIPKDNGKTALEPTSPAPKKRGRKRKKTSEQAAEAPNDELPHQPADPPDTDSGRQPLDGNNPPFSVVLNNTNKDLDTHTPDPEPHTSDKLNNNDPSPTKPLESAKETNHAAPETPRKHDLPKTPAKGPGKHSPISTTSKVPYRVGLSRRARIAPLLKIVKRE